MKTNAEYIELVRRSVTKGLSPAEILRLLSKDEGLNVGHIHRVLLDTFNVDFSDITCIGGWWHDGTSELGDSQINKFLEPYMCISRLKRDL
jgi:hypothetical protein